MKRILSAWLLLLTVDICASAQQTVFVPNCSGTNDTASFTSLLGMIGTANPATIQPPWKNNTTQRCKVTVDLTLSSNITIDNTNGSGIAVAAGKVLTVLGPIVSPVGKQTFFGPGSTVFTGNTFIGTNGQSLVSDGVGGLGWTTITGGGGGGAVESFNGRTGPVMPVSNDYTWAQINIASSSLGDLTLRSADLLSNGTIGTGQVVLKDSPTLTTPVLGVATATSINGLTITTSTGTLTIANGKTVTVNNSLTLAGASDGFTLTVPATGTAVLTSRTITEGAGLAGNTYDLSANRTLALGTPSTLSVSSLTSVSGTTHSHAITSSSNPGTAASILASNGSGHLQLVRLGIATAPTQPLEVGGNVFINAATANLFMKDTNTGWQAATTTVVTPQANNSVRSSAFTSGVNGWNINAVGDAEFNNVRVRGEIAASVFKVSEITATAGTLGVFKSASNLVSDTTSPSISATDDFVAENSDLGGALFAVGDRLRFKGFTGAGIADVWYTVNTVTNNGATSTYNATMQSGSTGVLLPAGMAIVDYGPSGTGFITLSTDGTVGSSPNMTMATHAGSPWSTFTTLLRAGNLNGSYGYATDVYGWATGQHGVASQSWLTVEQTNGIRIGNNTTVLGQWDTSGNITVGQVSAGQPNVFISAGQLDIRTNTTPRIRLAADGGGFVANSLFSWDASGNVSILGNANIAGWTISSNALTKNEVKLAAGVDAALVAGTTEAWFGKGSTGYVGLLIKGTTAANMQMIAGNTAVSAAGRPYLTVHDGTRYRIALGELNTTVWDGAATNSMGMKIWSSAGTKLVEFSDVQNVISGWTINATSILSGSGSTTVAMDSGGTNPAFYAGSSTPGSAPFRVTNAGALTASNATITGAITATSGAFTGTVQISSASGALAIGATPPTGPLAGTGIWIDRDAIVALTAGTPTAYFTSTGISTIGSGSLEAKNAAGVALSLSTNNASGGFTESKISIDTSGTGSKGRLTMQALAAADLSNTIIQINAGQFGAGDVRVFNDSATITGLTVGANATPAAMLDVRGAVKGDSVQWNTGTRPTCDSGNRGKVWYVAGGAGVSDTFEVCRKNASDVFAWVTLF